MHLILAATCVHMIPIHSQRIQFKTNTQNTTDSNQFVRSYIEENMKLSFRSQFRTSLLRTSSRQRNCAAWMSLFLLTKEPVESYTRTLGLTFAPKETLMSTTPVDQFLKSVCRPPDGTYSGPGTPESWWDQFNINWGFTIYLTFYGEGSNEQWRKLLLKITRGAKHEIADLEGDLTAQSPR